jgi:amino acid adenylation domain-containing protein
MNATPSTIQKALQPATAPALPTWLRLSAARSPDKLALETPARSWTYAQLLAEVSALSEDLQQRGLRPGDRIGIAATRSPDTVVAILAAVDAGLAYVTLDLSYPPLRLRAMFDEALPRLVLGEASALQELEALIGTFPRLDQTSQETPPLFAAEPDLCYVLFTSGSTGKPKGVALGSQPLAHLIAFHAAHPRLGQPARTLQFAPLSFDVHFQEILSSVACGGTLVLLPEAVRRDPEQLHSAVAKLGIERLFMPYVALQMLADAATSDALLALQDVISAGEQLQVTPAIRALFQGLPGAELHNHFGPTESHVCTAHELHGNPAHWPEIPPIGVALPHVQLALHNRMASDDGAPGSTIGELLLGGETLAHGYLRRPELSAERFHTDFDKLPGRWYVTGDLVRRDAQGVCAYFGRVDQQLKVDGFRIKAGEIELALMTLAAFKDAVVTAPELTGVGKQLMVQLVLRGASADATSMITEFRANLRASLSEYMVLVRFLTLDRSSIANTGKINCQIQRATSEDHPNLGSRVAWLAGRCRRSMAVAKAGQTTLRDGLPRFRGTNSVVRARDTRGMIV